MRKLPIYLVLDVSESMAGEPIDNVQEGVRTLIHTLMNDPQALETAYISVIAFAGSARVITPLSSIATFTMPSLPIGSGTNLSPALELLSNDIEKNVKKNTPEEKGDWRPIVFILTDGSPNDNYSSAIQKWRTKHSKIPVVGVLMGAHSSAAALQMLTTNIIVFKEATAESYKAFFKWVSASVQTTSQQIGATGKDSPIDQKLIENMNRDLIITTPPAETDVEHAVIVARCQSTKKPYIIRAVRHNNGPFTWDGAYPIDESYFEMSGASSEEENKIVFDKMSGNQPKCPYCENEIMGLDTCGKWLCLSRSKLQNVVCPWCGKHTNFGGSVHETSAGRG